MVGECALAEFNPGTSVARVQATIFPNTPTDRNPLRLIRLTACAIILVQVPGSNRPADSPSKLIIWVGRWVYLEASTGPTSTMIP